MKQVSIEQVSKDLPGYLQVAEQEYIVITREGVAVGILINWFRRLGRLVGRVTFTESTVSQANRKGSKEFEGRKGY